MLIGARNAMTIPMSSGPSSAYWGLCFTAEEANSTVAMYSSRSGAPSVSLVYSTDGTNWNDFVVGTTTVVLPNVGDKVWFKANTTNEKMGSGLLNYNKFTMKGKIAASGSIMSLLDGENETFAISASFCFINLFNGCASLTSAPELPATTLVRYCYRTMFRDCASLTSAPALPATTLVDSCYYGMFQDCASLSSINVNFSTFSNATTNWVSNVAANGTFTCPTALGTNDTIARGANNCPNGWTVVNK